MCGIAGFSGRQESEAAQRREIAARMTRTLHHRGPDGAGIHVESGIALGHRRLSIIDLATGQQPLGNEDGTVRVVCNGEIYNFPELRRQLEERGHRFHTGSDSETIVHAYEEWGVGCLASLHGMFAFALWDRARQRLFLARDRLGKKPLYYARVGGSLVFASEIKALLEFPGFERTIDLTAFSDYLSLGYVPAPKTIFAGVNKLAPGWYLVAEGQGEERLRQYWDVRFSDATPREQPAERLAALLRDAVSVRLRSDVPVGAFLSGGVDSSAVVGMMAATNSAPVSTVSIGFSDAAFDELAYARQISRRFGTRHHEQVLQPDAVAVLERLIWHYDEPFGDSSALPTYYVSKLARQHFTVALSGDGGDESFAGYRRYSMDVRENWFRRILPSALRQPVFGALGRLYPQADYLPQVFRGRAFLGNLARTPWSAYLHSVSGIDRADKESLLAPDVRASLADYTTDTLFEDLYRASEAPDTLSRIQYIDFKTYLPGDILTKVDRASMANSLEVRCPLLDHTLVEFAASLPSRCKLDGSRTKLVLKEALRGLLPEEILQRPKMGFSLPLADWLRHDLKPCVEEYVLDSSRQHDLFHEPVVRRWWHEHRSGRRDRTTGLWALLVFNMWYERFMRASPDCA